MVFRLFQYSLHTIHDSKNNLAAALGFGPLATIQKKLQKMYLEISQNSQENACARDSFLKKLQTFY